MYVGMLSRSSLVPRFGGLVSRRFTSSEVHPQPIVVSRLPDSPGIALIQFHRPEKMNAMNIGMDRVSIGGGGGRERERERVFIPSLRTSSL